MAKGILDKVPFLRSPLPLELTPPPQMNSMQTQCFPVASNPASRPPPPFQRLLAEWARFAVGPRQTGLHVLPLAVVCSPPPVVVGRDLWKVTDTLTVLDKE